MVSEQARAFTAEGAKKFRADRQGNLSGRELRPD